MIRSYLIREFDKFGAEAELVDRLLLYGDKPLIAWLTHRFCADSGQPVKETLEALSTLIDVSYERLKYAYFKAKVQTPLVELTKREEFNYVVSTLLSSYPYPELWKNLLPYVYRHAINVCIELDTAGGISAEVIEVKLNVSRSQAYKIRKDYLQRYITKRGNI